jgi:capsular polysaccharide biosynthesis protein
VSDQTLELRTVLASVRRHRRLVASLGAIGLVGGIAYGFLTPALASATSLVLLPNSATAVAGAPSSDIGTQAVIATSTPVLTQAGRAVSPALGAATLKKRVTASAVSKNVLSIHAEAPTAGEAERLANSVASDYIRYVTATSSTSNGDVASGLTAEATRLTKEIHNLQSRINVVSARLANEDASSTAGEQDAALLGSLRNQQASYAGQLNTVNNEIVEAKANGGLIPGEIRVLQPATTGTGSSLLRLPIMGVVGLVVGLLLGSLCVLFWARRDRRLYRRGDLAAAVGLPVVASLGAQRCRTVEDWNRLLEHYEPSPVDVLNLRRLLRRMDVGDNRSFVHVQVVSLSEDRPALSVGPQLAAFAASTGARTVLSTTNDPEAIQLRAACALPRVGRPENLVTVDDPDGQARPEGAALRVSVAVVERSQPELERTSGATSLIAVSSGFATADDLARLALAAFEVGQRFDGILVVNPDPADKTIGDLPEVARPGRVSPSNEVRPRARSRAMSRRT